MYICISIMKFCAAVVARETRTHAANRVDDV